MATIGRLMKMGSNIPRLPRHFRSVLLLPRRSSSPYPSVKSQYYEESGFMSPALASSRLTDEGMDFV